MNLSFNRADIVLVDFNPAMPTEAAKTRPAIIVTNNAANEFSPVLVVIPLTTNLQNIYPHEIVLPKTQTGLDQDSKAQIALIRHISKARVKRVIGFVPDEWMQQVNSRIREHLG